MTNTVSTISSFSNPPDHFQIQRLQKELDDLKLEMQVVLWL